MNKQNVYLVTIITQDYTFYDCYHMKELGKQIVFGKQQLDIILRNFPYSEWKYIENNGEENYSFYIPEVKNG